MFKNLQAALSKLREGQHATPQPTFGVNEKVETKTSTAPLTKPNQTFQDDFEVMEADQDLLDLLDEIEEQQSQQSQLKVPEDVLEIENDSTTVGSLPTLKFIRTGYPSKPKDQTASSTSGQSIQANMDSPLLKSRTSISNDHSSTSSKEIPPISGELNKPASPIPSHSSTSKSSQVPALSGSQKLQGFLYKKPKSSQSTPSKNQTNNNNNNSTSTKSSEDLPIPSIPAKSHGSATESLPGQNSRITSTFQSHKQRPAHESNRPALDVLNKQENTNLKTPSKPKSDFLATLNANRAHTPMNQTLCKSVSEPRQNARGSSITSTSHTDRKNYSTGKIKSRVRRLPGPAGDILALGSFDSKTKPVNQDSSGTSLLSSPKTPSRSRHSAFQEDDFISGAWSKMLTTLNLPKYTPATAPFVKNTSPFLSYNIQYILEHGFQKKIPYVILMIKETRSNEINVGVTFVDPTGEISGTIHRKVVEMYPDDIATGTVLVLQQVSVFSPSLHSHYLNVTPQNIVHLFPSTREEVLSPAATQSSCQPSDPSISPLKEKSKFNFTDSMLHQSQPFAPEEQDNLVGLPLQSRTTVDADSTSSDADIPLFLKRKSSELVETSNVLDESKFPEPKRQLFTDRLFSKNLEISSKPLSEPCKNMTETELTISSPTTKIEQSSQPLFSNSQPVVEEDLECLLDGIEESFFEDDLL